MTKTNSSTPVSAIVLAAGLGTRMRSKLPKVMHKIAGLPLVNHVANALTNSNITDITIVVGPDMQIVSDAIAPHPAVEQTDQRGTGDAVKAALDHIPNEKGHVLVLFGADPLIQPETITRMIERRQQADDPFAQVLRCAISQRHLVFDLLGLP